jgi:TonB-linked SusC/RagA family outer membrane protein
MRKKLHTASKSIFMLVMLSMITFLINAQETQISGRITDGSNGEGLPGASLLIKGTSKGTTTDASGNFKITAFPNSTLIISSIGYLNQEVIVGNRNVINLALATDTKALEEVVVVGYGTQKKSQLTGAISSVSAKQITEMPITNMGQALQGRVAGVDVAQTGSRPGSTPTIRIRGRRSFRASNDPLYVVDGIPLSAGYEDINPNDVVSTEILKDATATAIYGARGANGVIIITTKRGPVAGKKTTISYDTYYGTSKALDKIELFSGPEFAEYIRESRRGVVSGSLYKDANGNPVPSGVVDAFADSKLFEAVELDGIAAGRTTDYQDLILQTGIQQNHSLGVQGGTEKTQFYISGGFFQDKGIMYGLDYTRTSLRANIDHNINNSIKIGLSSYLMYSVRNGENLNPYGFTLQQNPLGKAFDEKGNLIFEPTNDALLSNPLAEVVPGAQVDNVKKYRMFNSLFANVKIMEGLNYRVNFGPDFTNRKTGRFIGSLTNNRRRGDALASTSAEFGFNYTLENILNYNKSFGKHNFSATALHSIQRDNFETLGNSVQAVPAESQSFNNVGNAAIVLGVGSNLIQWTINSYMGRLNYDYNDKYLVTATLRRDGSSRFGVNTKYGNFPAIALGWNVSNESFLKDINAIDLIKVRASWGSVGNQAVAPYQTQGLLARTIYAFGTTSAFGYRPGTIGNPDLQWETSTTSNVGVDFSLYRGRVSGSLELYKTNTTDLLLNDQLPGSIGFSAVTKNVGETQNKGIELTLSTINIDTKGGFKWTTDFQFTKNNEQIVSLYNGKIDDLGNRWFIGKPLTQYFDYKKQGIWQLGEEDAAKAFGSRVGQIKVQDVNGRDASGKLTGAPDGKINADDRQFLGSEIPDFSLGITNRFEIGGFDLSAIIFARIGQTILSGFHLNNNALAGRYQQIKVDYWTPKNPTNEFPQPNKDQEFPVNNTAISFFDGSFVKLRNINLGYTVPAKIVQKLGLESLRLFSSIQQPKIWSEYRTKYNGVDPESGNENTGTGQAQSVSNNTVPATRIVTFGLNVKF